jgi:hypothetical protein
MQQQDSIRVDRLFRAVAGYRLEHRPGNLDFVGLVLSVLQATSAAPENSMLMPDVRVYDYLLLFQPPQYLFPSLDRSIINLSAFNPQQ